MGVAIVVTSVALASLCGCQGGLKSGGTIQMPAEGTTFGQPATTPAAPVVSPTPTPTPPVIPPTTPTPVTYRLDIHITGMGLVKSADGAIYTAVDLSQSFAADVPVTLQTINDGGFGFARWEGDCTGSAAECTLVMNVHHTVTAVFEPMKYLQVTVTGPGKVMIDGATCIAGGSECVRTFSPADAPVSITLVADAGDGTFDGWGGACASYGTTSRECPIVMDASKDVTAGFTAPPGPPVVVSTNPRVNERNVSMFKTLEATFDMPMEPTSVTSAFTLKKNDIPVAGTVSPSGSAVKFAPSVKLDPHTTYNATITTAARSMDDVALASDFSWLFTTVDWTWGEPFPVEFESTYADMPDVAMDKKGNAVVAWWQSDAGSPDVGRIFMKIYKAGTDWKRVTDAKILGLGRISYPRVAVNGNDKAVVVWREFLLDERKWKIHAQWFDIKTGRADADPFVVYYDNYMVEDLDVGLDDEGTATIAWMRKNDALSRMMVYAVRTKGDAPPSEKILNNSLVEREADSLQVAVNGAGDAVVIWRSSDFLASVTNDVHVGDSVYRKVSSSWTTPGYLDNALAAEVIRIARPRAAINAAGDILVAWNESDSSGRISDVKAKKWNTAGGVPWMEVPRIELSDTETAVAPNIAINENGKAVIAWLQGAEIDHLGACANICDLRANTCVGEAKISATLFADQNMPIYATMDGEENAALVWITKPTEGTPPKSYIYAARFLAGTGWGDALDEMASITSAMFRFVVVDGNSSGDAIAVWQQMVATAAGLLSEDLYASHFQLPQVIMGPAVTPAAAAKIPPSGVRIPSP